MNATKNETMKSKRSNQMYIGSFLKKGNRKLKDYYDQVNETWYRYAQFNLPAKSTCPYATDGCKKFCYAKRDERFTSPKENRIKSFQASKDPNFSERLIYTIETELSSKRFSNAIMILRLHESGDFYNERYLSDWVKTINCFTSQERNVIFQAYTKSFRYFIDIAQNKPDLYFQILNAMNRNKFALSLSYDKTMQLKQLADLMKVKKYYPKANIYAAIPETDMNDYKHDTECDCADCAKCGKCIKTSGQTVAVAIH